MSTDTSFRDLVARLNAMNNVTPEQERASLMEAAGKAPKVLDDKDISLADIAKLAGIKEYVEPVKHSKKAEALVESIITKARDKEGNKVFVDADRVKLMNEADPLVVVRVATTINNDRITGTQESISKE